MLVELLALILLGIGLTLLVLKAYRVWMSQQLYLVIAMRLPRSGAVSR